MVLRIVGRLLTERFGNNAVDIKAFTPEHVRRFFAEQAALHSKPAGAGSVLSSLRGYFRSRASLGDLVHGLIGAGLPGQLGPVFAAIAQVCHLPCSTPMKSTT